MPDGELRPYRATEDAVRYNDVLLRIAEDEGLAVNDLYAFVLAQPPELQRPGNVHFTEDGSRALGLEVASILLASAGSPPPP